MRKRYLTVSALLALDVMARTAPLHITCVAHQGVAQIRIEGNIDRWQNSASEFRAKVDALVADGIKDVNVYLNTRGGSVFEANEITNIIARFPGNVSGEGGALVASAGTYIGIRLKRFGMPANGMYMWHKPEAELEGNQDKIKADLALLDKLTNLYRKAYADKTGQAENDIEARWSKGDVWLTAQEALEQGFIDHITDEETLDAEDLAALAACGAPEDKLPKATAKPTPTPVTEKDTMDPKALRISLGLPETASDADVLNATNRLREGAEKAVKDQKEARAKQVKDLIDAAIKDRKITEAHRKGFEAKFDADFDATQTELDGIEAVALVANATVKTGSPAAQDGRADWDYDKWMQQDEAGLNALRKADPKRFQALASGRYGADMAAKLFPIE